MIIYTNYFFPWESILKRLYHIIWEIWFTQWVTPSFTFWNNLGIIPYDIWEWKDMNHPEVFSCYNHVLESPLFFSCVFFCLFFNSYSIYLFIYLFLAVLGLCFVRGLSLAAASGGHSSLRCTGLSPSRPLPLRGTGSRRAGSAVVAHGPSCSEACGIFPDQGSNPCPLHWQADSQPLRHQGSPLVVF